MATAAIKRIPRKKVLEKIIFIKQMNQKYSDLDKKIKSAKTELGEIMESCGVDEIAVTDDNKVTHKCRFEHRAKYDVNDKLLKAENPEIYEKYVEDHSYTFVGIK